MQRINCNWPFVLVCLGLYKIECVIMSNTEHRWFEPNCFQKLAIKLYGLFLWCLLLCCLSCFGAWQPLVTILFCGIKCFKTSLCVLHGRIKKNISCTLQFEKSEFRNIQCIRKVFTALHFFHILLCYSLIPKFIKFIIFLKIIQTIPHNDNMKEVWNLEIKNEKNSCT